MYIAQGQGLTTLVDELMTSTGTSCHFGHLLLVLYHSDFINFFFDFYDLLHVYSPGAGGIQPLGDKVLMSTETSCHFGHLLLFSNHRPQ